MKDLLEAITIFTKYNDDANPSYCYNEIMFFAVNPREFEEEDIKRLRRLGFQPCFNEPVGPNSDYKITGFYSYRFGTTFN